MKEQKLSKEKLLKDTEPKRREIDEILDAQGEFFDRIWYQRKLELIEKVKDGIEKAIDPDIEKRMRAEMARVERQYGGKKALAEHCTNKYELGYIHGKLSALRWVLGDEWDNLDT